MFGLKKGKVETKLIEIKDRLNILNIEKVGTEMGTHPLNEHQVLEIRTEIMALIEELQRVINLSQSLHKLVKREEAIQKIIDEQL